MSKYVWNITETLSCTSCATFFGFTKFWPHLWTDTLNKALICQWTGLYELVLRPMRCFSFCFPCREMQITPCGGLILFSLCTQCFNKFENAKMMRYMYITCVKLIVTVELTFAPSLSNTLLSLTYEHKPNICQKKIQQLPWIKKFNLLSYLHLLTHQNLNTLIDWFFPQTLNVTNISPASTGTLTVCPSSTPAS